MTITRNEMFAFYNKCSIAFAGIVEKDDDVAILFNEVLGHYSKEILDLAFAELINVGGYKKLNDIAEQAKKEYNKGLHSKNIQDEVLTSTHKGDKEAYVNILTHPNLDEARKHRESIKLKLTDKQKKTILYEFFNGKRSTYRAKGKIDFKVFKEICRFKFDDSVSVVQHINLRFGPIPHTDKSGNSFIYHGFVRTDSNDPDSDIWTEGK